MCGLQGQGQGECVFDSISLSSSGFFCLLEAICQETYYVCAVLDGCGCFFSFKRDGFVMLRSWLCLLRSGLCVSSVFGDINILFWKWFFVVSVHVYLVMAITIELSNIGAGSLIERGVFM